ncbi:SpoIIE family protein phosphatase [Streptomyces clavuligerus]|nr:SpoIIE family protein phosphatase [Streptomyces clavuligerus]AXU16763.1 PAS sensor protein [Streptomyces clavuligerus]MBY6306346.1 SpoIIE family protein phosphatase [Streptomyces clavuligerus]QCS09523.1 PAS sensor protein [Streptomyces clavuligerus]QPJ91691.1 SpoIIE family protein phosphatase [Streptomyces clavuligerus]QPL66179.1 SpoIIE family protein phosphatase [Streptomyces clavuligerus]
MVVKAGLPRAFSTPWERISLASPLPVADAVRERRLVWVADEEEMARRYPRIAVALPYQYRFAALPVATDGKIYGAAYLTWPVSHPPELSPTERELLTAACERLAHRLRRSAATGVVVAEPDFLGAPPAGPEGADGASLAQRALDRFSEGVCALDVNSRVVCANAATGDLVGIPAADLVGRVLWTSVPWLNDPVYEDRYRAALMSQRTTSFTALRPPRDWLDFRLHPGRDGVTAHITRAASAVPAAATGTGNPAERHPARLVTIAHIANLAIALTEAVGVSDVVDLVADEIMPSLGGSALVLLGSENGRLRVLGQRGYVDRGLVERFDGVPLTAPIPGAQALITGVPSFFESQEELERVYPERHTTPDGLRAWAYLPLIASGRPVGTCVLGFAREHRFSTDERSVLTSLGGLIAQALERARLYDTKHRLAHGLQSALLPSSLPAIDGLQTAARYLAGTQGMDIGGDFYDLVPAGRSAAAVIGDIQGHNVTAAALMGQVRTAVRAYVAVGQPPGQVMESTNRLLIDLKADLLASCVHLHLDLAGRAAHIARAGHPQPLLREPDGTVRALDLTGGPLLGVDAGAVYPTTWLPLAPGSVLALYTDGLVENPGIDIDDALAGLARRLGTADPDGPLEELADLLIGPPGTRDRRGDDIALLLLRPTG